LKEAEEYYWAMTQALGWLCCGHSVSSVMVFEFKLDCLAYTRIVECSNLQRTVAQVGECN
jgi:hypothetical protein